MNRYIRKFSKIKRKKVIYIHIWGKKGRKYLKRDNKKDSRGIIKNRISIDKRPKIVEKSKRFGAIEVNLIIGKIIFRQYLP